MEGTGVPRKGGIPQTGRWGVLPRVVSLFAVTQEDFLVTARIPVFTSVCLFMGGGERAGDSTPSTGGGDETYLHPLGGDTSNQLMHERGTPSS